MTPILMHGGGGSEKKHTVSTKTRENINQEKV